MGFGANFTVTLNGMQHYVADHEVYIVPKQKREKGERERGLNRRLELQVLSLMYFFLEVCEK